MSPSVGARLGHYEVTALIGEGGMDQVYQATDRQAQPAGGTESVAASLHGRGVRVERVWRIAARGMST